MVDAALPIIENEFTVFTVVIAIKEALIAYCRSIFHMHNQVVTLTFIAAHHRLGAMDTYNTALRQSDRLCSCCYVSDSGTAMTSNNINSPKGKIGLCHVSQASERPS